MSPPSENTMIRMPEAGTMATAFAALLLGALAMGASPIFVRYAEVGPFTSAFYRVFLSLPLLALWAHLEAGGRAPARWDRATLLAGLFFAGDLIFWHLAVVNTTMANATFLATMAPVWVLLGSGLFIGEKVTKPMVAGLGLCLLGAAALVGSSIRVEPERLTGDMFGIITSVFFGCYFLAVRVARRRSRPGLILYRSTLVTASALFIAALIMEDTFLPGTWAGVSALVALAVISHTGGQGLLAFALGHLSAAFSSLVIFLEAVAAGFFGWLIFAEALTPLQFAGGGAILAGIWVARPRHGATAPAASPAPAPLPTDAD
ncbi:DMT family transporter [Breoghania sp. JC706]|uniref:DMT family transporter n=1 Tax=Breoghania sp. JC706 TaxID=3117732 RepID=UPI00300B3605